MHCTSIGLVIETLPTTNTAQPCRIGDEGARGIRGEAQIRRKDAS